MIQVNFSLQEIQALTQLLDIAVKSGGLRVAGDAFLLHQKLVLSIEQARKETPAETN